MDELCWSLLSHPLALKYPLPRRLVRAGAGADIQGGTCVSAGGVMLLDLVAGGAEQRLMFAQTLGDPERSNWLMDALDGISRERGRGTVRYAAEGLGERWWMR